MTGPTTEPSAYCHFSLREGTRQGEEGSSALPLIISYGKITPLGKPFLGGMAEWTKAAVLKTAVGVKAHRGFESLSLRLTILPGEVPEWLIGAAC